MILLMFIDLFDCVDDEKEKLKAPARQPSWGSQHSNDADLSLSHYNDDV